ncbi:MAG: ATP-binding protein [Deltaproteobacteria bacterium]|nr:ATP-binding protein [Deltaproteobacteria bacterium]
MATTQAIEPYGSSSEHLRDELARLDVLVRGQVARAREASGGDPYRGLVIGEAEVDALIVRALGAPPWDAAAGGPSLDEARDAAARMAERIAHRCARATAPLRLAELARRYGLDRFELDAVVIALAPELDLRYERLFAYLHDDVNRKRPSVDLALHLACATFEERLAARARFAADAALVGGGLLHILGDDATPLLARGLKLDERVVDYLHGSDRLAPRLARHARRIAPAIAIDDLILTAPARSALAALAAAADPTTRPPRSALAVPAADSTPPPPALYLHGPAGAGKRTVAEAWAAAHGCALLSLDASTLDGLPDDAAQAVVAAAAREARLTGDVLAIERADLILLGDRAAARGAAVAALAATPLVVATGEQPWEPTDALRDRTVVRIPIDPPDVGGRERLWRAALAGDALADGVDVAAFAHRLRLTGGQIWDAAATARGLARARGAAALATSDLDEACRRQSGRRFGAFARKVPTRVGWHELVLAEARLERLQELCDHARHRAVVLERWGFDRRLPNNKGLGVLFAGAPGTGKTLAASIIAGELGLDLFQIDLAAVVSKWIGETEKHLSRIFDEAERGNAVLFFDEADALFGKRTELRDAHDRYANLETSYLLQRIESYEGVVILASNFRRNLDDAFVRRLRFIIEFPLPDAQERLLIWERIWPAETPRAADLDLPLLAERLELAGAHIRNIALAAAFLAAAEHTPVAQRHLLRAARREYQKLGKMVDETLA